MNLECGAGAEMSSKALGMKSWLIFLQCFLLEASPKRLKNVIKSLGEKGGSLFSTPLGKGRKKLLGIYLQDEEAPGP